MHTNTPEVDSHIHELLQQSPRQPNEPTQTARQPNEPTPTMALVVVGADSEAGCAFLRHLLAVREQLLLRRGAFVAVVALVGRGGAVHPRTWRPPSEFSPESRGGSSQLLHSSSPWWQVGLLTLVAPAGLPSLLPSKRFEPMHKAMRLLAWVLRTLL